MNLIFRMLFIIFFARRGQPVSVQQARRDKFRVWLHDLGWRDHLPNYRVFSFMELGRFGLWHQSRLALSGRYSLRMIAAQDVVYLRPIRPFQAFEMSSEILSWDEKYFYYQHKFFSKGKLVAIGLVKEVNLKAGVAVMPQSLLADGKLDPCLSQTATQLHPITDKWLQTQQAIKSSC